MDGKRRLIIIFVVILVVYQLVFSILKAEHKMVYKIVKNKDKYTIVENYYRSDNHEYYYISVEYNDDQYIFTVDNAFHKSKQVVKDILKYEMKTATCLVLELSNDEYTEPMCRKDDVLYSYLAIKDDIENDELNNYYYQKSYNTDQIRTVGEDKIIVNKNFLDEGEYIVVYNEKEIDVFSENGFKSFQFGEIDTYKNEYGYLVDKYYVVPEVTSKPEFKKYYVYDIVNNTSKEIKLETAISKSSIINGIHNNKLYLVDKSRVRQYLLDPVELTVDVLARDKEDAYLYAKGEEERVSIYTLIEDEPEFGETVDKEYQAIKYDKMHQNDNYAYYTKNGSFYKVYKDYIDSPICLFKMSKAKNIVMRGDNIYFIVGSSLMKYNSHGLNEMIDYSEFEHNYKHIFDVYIK